jgi:hypothetical protein
MKDSVTRRRGEAERSNSVLRAFASSRDTSNPSDPQRGVDDQSNDAIEAAGGPNGAVG